MAYIKTEEVAAIRGQLKEKFKGLKFSVFSDILDDSGYAQINQYWLNRTGKHEHLFEEIYKVIKTAPASVEGGREWFDDSDSMTDYFHTAFYMSVNVGSWDKPYVYNNPYSKKKTAKKTSKKVLDTSINKSAEAVARMTKEEREEFVNYIVDRFPNLADDLMSSIGYGLMEKEGSL